MNTVFFSQEPTGLRPVDICIDINNMAQGSVNTNEWKIIDLLDSFVVLIFSMQEYRTSKELN